jgi:glycosyltransferase involved in cell wall biosynthesis
MAKVSIIVPCYNAERWVEAAVESCFAQSHSDIECIVVDDGSTDSTVKLVQRLEKRANGDLTLIKGCKQRGAPTARNLGAAQARGEWLLFLDADDFLANDAVIKLLEVAEVHGVAYGDVQWIREDGEPLYVQRFGGARRDPIMAMMTAAPPTGSALVHRACLESVRWRDQLPCAQEFAFFNDLALAGARFVHIEQVTLNARQHSSQSRISIKAGNRLTETLVGLFCEYGDALRNSGRSTSEREILLNTVYGDLLLRLLMSGGVRKELVDALEDRVRRAPLRAAEGFRWMSPLGLAYAVGFWGAARVLRGAIRVRHVLRGYVAASQVDAA